MVFRWASVAVTVCRDAAYVAWVLATQSEGWDFVFCVCLCTLSMLSAISSNCVRVCLCL